MLGGWRRRRGSAARNLNAETDEALLLLAQGGDADAFETLVRRYTQPLYAFATRILRDADDAADVAQHTFVQCYHALPRLRADTALRPWLYRVTRNRCLDLLRQRRAIQPDTSRDEDDALDALSALPDTGPSLESLAERRDLQRLLAEAIGIPENSAKTLFQRAKTMLRLSLRQWVQTEV